MPPLIKILATPFLTRNALRIQFLRYKPYLTKVANTQTLPQHEIIMQPPPSPIPPVVDQEENEIPRVEDLKEEKEEEEIWVLAGSNWFVVKWHGEMKKREERGELEVDEMPPVGKKL